MADTNWDDHVEKLLAHLKTNKQKMINFIKEKR
mgnify:CR=1 FL=1